MAALTSIAAGAALLQTGIGLHESTMAKKHAKGVASAENKRIGEATKKAASERESLIKEQRRNLGVDSTFKLNPTGSRGVKSINEGLLA